MPALFPLRPRGHAKLTALGKSPEVRATSGVILDHVLVDNPAFLGFEFLSKGPKRVYRGVVERVHYRFSVMWSQLSATFWIMSL